MTISISYPYLSTARTFGIDYKLALLYAVYQDIQNGFVSDKAMLVRDVDTLSRLPAKQLEALKDVYNAEKKRQFPIMIKDKARERAYRMGHTASHDADMPADFWQVYIDAEIKYLQDQDNAWLRYA